jgi:hypothetical protein
MKSDPPPHLNLASQEERAILDEIRNDHDLIARLNITPQELEALSKCALLGTLTCKQDMLFILRQIREATGPTIDHTTLFPSPPELATVEEDYGPDLRHFKARVAGPPIIPEPGSLDSIVRRRLPVRFGVLFWVVVLAAGLVWNGVLIISRWRDTLMTTVGTPVSQAPVADAWYDKMDHPNVLLFWEILFVVVIALVIHLKSQRGSSRFKVRPGRRLR